MVESNDMRVIPTPSSKTGCFTTIERTGESYFIANQVTTPCDASTRVCEVGLGV